PGGSAVFRRAERDALRSTPDELPGAGPGGQRTSRTGRDHAGSDGQTLGHGATQRLQSVAPGELHGSGRRTGASVGDNVLPIATSTTDPEVRSVQPDQPNLLL